MTDHSTKSSDWALSVAADSIQFVAPWANACAAAAGRMASLGKFKPFEIALGNLYLAAKTVEQRRAVVAVNPALFRTFAVMSGNVFDLVDAGFDSPAPPKGMEEYSYTHEYLGKLTCHISAELADQGGPDCPPDYGDVQVEAVYMGAVDMTERMKDDELSSIRHCFCADRGWLAGGRICIPAARMTYETPDCAHFAKSVESSHAS